MSVLVKPKAGIEGITIREDSETTIGTRPTLNIIEGAGMLLDLADDPTDDEIDFTIVSKYSHYTKILEPDRAALPASNPAALSTVAGTNFPYKVLDFDPTTEESAYWEDYLTPDYLSEHLTIDIYWISAGTGDAKFGVRVGGREDGETWDAALGAEYYVVDTNTGAGKLNRARILSMPALWEAGDVILLKLARKAGDAEDTINANDVRVVKVVFGLTLAFGQSFYNLAEYVDVTPSTGDTWEDVDCSAYIPEGATGVVLHAISQFPTQHPDFGVRKKGSTDTRYQKFYYDSHQWVMIGVDDDRIFQCRCYNPNFWDIWLVGYTIDEGVTFFDNGTDVSPAIEDSWETVTLNTLCPNAIGIIFEVANVGTLSSYSFGLRKYGSSSNVTSPIGYHHWHIVGCDGNQRVQLWRGDTKVHFWVIGYVTKGAYFLTNMADKSLGTTGSYQTITCSELPACCMVFFQVDVNTNQDFALRRKTSTEDIYEMGAGLTGGFIECDANNKVEGKIANTAIDFWLVGGATTTF